MRFIVLILIVLNAWVVLIDSTPTALTWSKIRRNEAAPEEGVVPELLKEIGENPELILKPLREGRIICRDFPRPRRELRVPYDAIEPSDSTCTGCKLILTVLDTLVGLGCDYEDLKPLLMTACQVIIKGRDLNPDIICEPTLDNYGPAIQEISEKNKRSPTESCFFLNLCISDTTLNATTWKQGISHETKLETESNSGEKKTLKSDVIRYSEQLSRPKREERDSGILRIAQITDIHVDEEYAVGSATDCGLPLCCRNHYEGTGSAGPHGEWKCNVPPSTTKKFLNKLASFDPHLVFYTGDSPPHHLWMETMDGMYNTTLLVGEMLNEAFPDAPIFSTIGNHENFPTNMYYPGGREETKLFHDVFIDAYGDLGGLEAEQEATIRNGGYYSKLIRPGLRLLAYNSNFGYTDNWYNLLNHGETKYEDMKAFMRNTLTNASSNNEKVLVITHHPSGEGVIQYDHDIKAILLDFSDIIKLIVAGHKHKESWRLFVDPDDKEAKLVQIMAQSSNTYDTVNPGARMYYFDNETLELLDFHQYYLDVSGDEPADAPIVLSYKMTEEYEMEDLTPAAWQDLTHRMAKDQDLFNKYWFNRRTRNGMDGDCTENCRISEICTINSAALDEYYACVNRYLADKEEGEPADGGSSDDGDHSNGDNGGNDVENSSLKSHISILVFSACTFLSILNI